MVIADVYKSTEITKMMFVSIHARRRDYMDHLKNYFNTTYFDIDEYFDKALKHFQLKFKEVPTYIIKRLLSNRL